MSPMAVRSAALALLVGLCSAGAQAGGARVGFAVAVPFAPLAPVAAPVIVPGAVLSMVPTGPVFVPPVVPVVPAFGGPIPMHAPVLFPWVTGGFVAPPVVLTTTVPVMVNAAPPLALFPVPAVVPHLPLFAPPLFFAPPAQAVVAPPLGGQVIIIRGSGF